MPASNGPASPRKWTATKAAIADQVNTTSNAESPIAASRLSYQQSPEIGQKQNAIDHATPPTGARLHRSSQRTDDAADVASRPVRINFEPYTSSADSTTTEVDESADPSPKSIDGVLNSPPRRAVVSLSPVDPATSPIDVDGTPATDATSAEEDAESSDDEIPTAEKEKQQQKQKAANQKPTWKKNRDDIIGGSELHEFARLALKTTTIEEGEFTVYYNKFHEQLKYKFQHWRTKGNSPSEAGGMALRSSLPNDDFGIDEDAYNVETTQITRLGQEAREADEGI